MSFIGIRDIDRDRTMIAPDEQCAPSIENVKGGVQKNDEAEIKAVILLKKKIGERQFNKLVALGYIEIKGKYGIYKVSADTVILERNDNIGKKIRPLTYTLCISTSKKIGYIPLADKLLSLYLSIKGNEDTFIQLANFRYVNTKDEFLERGETTLSTL